MKIIFALLIFLFTINSIFGVKRREPTERSDSKYTSSKQPKKVKTDSKTSSKHLPKRTNFAENKLSFHKNLHSKKSQKIIRKLVEIPEEPKPTYSEIVYQDEEFTLQIRARSFKQGNLAFLKLYSQTHQKPDFEKYKVFWREKQLNPIPYKDYFIFLLPIHPENEVGTQYLDTVREYDTKIVKKRFPIEIEKAHFLETKLFSVLKLPKIAKKLSPETIEFINKCDAKKREVFSLNTANKIDGEFLKPLAKLMVTSPFYAKRRYNLLKSKPHGGVDFRGGVGEKIYAIQSGKVVIAQRMYYEGIFTVIDHGNNLFSLYMHQSKLHVKEGDFVKRGDLIGEVGSTGMSTGPHLHLGLRVDGILVNPLSVIDLNLF